MGHSLPCEQILLLGGAVLNVSKQHGKVTMAVGYIAPCLTVRQSKVCCERVQYCGEMLARNSAIATADSTISCATANRVASLDTDVRS